MATPLAFRAPVPREVAPFKKVTVPVGVAPLAAATVAVRVRDWPAVRVVAEAVRAVVVGIPEATPFWTTWVTLAEALESFVFPP